MDWIDAEVHCPCLVAAPFIVPVPEAGRGSFAARARARFTMPHADADMLVTRAPCVCRESLLLLISSIYAAETQQEAATHRPRACDTVLSVVGIAQAARIASPCVLLVRLLGVVARLGHVGALRDGGVGRDGRPLVYSDRAWCQCSMWARLEPQ